MSWYRQAGLHHRMYSCVNSECHNFGVLVRIPATIAATISPSQRKQDGGSIGTFFQWPDLVCECGIMPEVARDTLAAKATKETK